MPTRRDFLTGTLALTAGLLCAETDTAAAPPAPAGDRRAEFAGRARVLLDSIDDQYLLRDSGLYRGTPGGAGPGFNWDQGVQLSALAGAARVDRGRAGSLRRFVGALDAYWHADANGLFGYDASPNNGGLDRYYDDNAWMALALVEAFEVTRGRPYLARAEQTVKFVLSGRDAVLGDGIYWHEQAKKGKNTCANAPAVAAMLRVARHEPRDAAANLRREALAIYRWTIGKLRDPADGLMWDAVGLDGEVNRTKWTYNTALMIRSAVLLAQSAADAAESRAFLADAGTQAEAAVKHWVDAATGAIKDGGRFAHLLADALVDLSDAAKEPRWRDVVERAADFAWANARDAEGYFGESWAEPPKAGGNKRELINQSSMARACARLAWPAGA